MCSAERKDHAPADTGLSVHENGNEKVDYIQRTDFRIYGLQPIDDGCEIDGNQSNYIA